MRQCSAAKMLFSSEIDSLHDDYFEGSINEHHICKKVYFGNDGGRGTKRCVVTGAINFEHDSSKHADIPLCSNSGNSAITSQEDPFEIKEGPREKSEHLHISEQYEWAMRDNSDVKVKRMKLSIDNPSNGMSYLHNGFNSSAPLKVVVSDAPQSALGFVTQSVTCRIVESARHGVSCSCYLLKKQSKMNLGGDIDGNDNCRYKLSSADVSEQKEVAASKAIASPVSQESSATKLLVASPAVVATDSGCHRPSKPRWKDACFIELDEAEMSLSRESKNDPRPLLRYHINRLLKAAGWVVGRRKRSNTYNGIGEYVYKSPEGRPIREFRRAWLLCGHTLLKASNTTYQENDVKQYVDLTQFWSDLNESTTKIEEMDDWETTSALAHCWYMLDPLAKVVFIDKLFSSLKAGKMVYARRSLVVKPKRASHAMLAMQTVEKAGNLLGDEHVTDQPHESSLGLNQALVCFNEVNIMKQDQYFENMQAVPATAQRGATSIISQENAVRNIECREISGTNRSGLDILYLQAYGSDSSSGQIGNDLFDVPINSQVANIYPGSETKKNKHLHGLNSKMITSEENLPVKCNSRGSGTKPRKNRMKDGNRQKKSSKCRLNDDDLLISAIVKNKSRKSTKKLSKVRKISLKSRTSKKNKNQRRNCRLLPRSFDRSGRHHIEGNCLPLGSRTVLSWLINSGVVSLNEVIQYRNTKDDTVVKDGLVTWDGILCRCCDTVLSVSEFKSHAGFRLNRPCLNLFMESGKPFTLCQLEAWSAEYKARKSPARTVQIDESDENDDSCGLCGGEGELICCDNCPSTFHRACLYEQDIPEGSWYCSHCTCQICGDVVNNKDPLKSTNSLTCSQCEHKFHNVCVHEKGIKAVEPSDIWFCGEECYKVHSGLHSRAGLMNFMSDGFAWTLLRCMHGDKKVHSAQRFVALKAECNLKLAVALTIMEECFLPMVDARTGIDMIPHVLYNWGSHFARLNYHGFYTVVLEKNDVLLSVASIRIHGATVAEMPLIATCSKYRRQGMCRHLMNVIEEMLRSIKVEKLVMSAIPALVETWTEGFGFERLEDDERRGLRRTANLMVFPGTVWLKKSLNISQVSKQQHIGSCSASPSENDDLGQPSRKPEVCMSAEEFGVKTELIPSNDVIQTDNDLNGVELSSKTEPTPSSGSYILMDKDENEGVDLHIKAAPIPSNDNIEMDKDRNKGVELDTKTKTEIIDEDQNGSVEPDARTELIPSNDNILIDKDQNESAKVDAKMELEPSDDSNILVDKDQNEGVEVDTKMELIPSDDNNMLIDKDQSEGVEHDVKKELIPSGSNIQVYKEQNEDVEIHFSKLFSEEKEGNNHSEVRDINSMEVYIEENIPDR